MLRDADVIERLRALAAGPAPDPRQAAIVLRRLYLTVFAAQLLVALLVGAALMALASGARAASDPFALVLLVLALGQLPLGWTLGCSAIRAGGRQAALSGTFSAAVLLSIPVWFGVLLLVSGQHFGYLLGIAAVVVIASALGLPITRLAANVVATVDPDPEHLPEERPA